jgi:hypothetical protein
MEADWEMEIGGSAPVIDTSWTGFEDLRRSPERASALPETQELSGLAEALVRLNADTSSVWTSKCDVWELEELDPDELDAPIGSAVSGIACYIDLLPRRDGDWADPVQAEEWCKSICSSIRAIPLGACRLDLIIRCAVIAPDDRNGLGVTAYLSACGPNRGAATVVLQSALAVFAGSVAR